MTVSTASATTGLLAGDGSNKSWPFTFPVQSSSQLEVLTVSSAGVVATISSGSYTVALSNSGRSGGTVTYPSSGSAVASGTYVIVRRSMDFLQPTNLRNQGTLAPETIEAVADRAVYMLQEVRDTAARALRQPVADADALDELPVAASRANKYLGFGSDGQPTMLNAASVVEGSPGGTALNFTYFIELDGDAWWTVNAYYDVNTASWMRVDETKSAWALQTQVQGLMPYETYSATTYWHAQAASNPINPVWATVGGWEMVYSYSEHRNFTVGGGGCEYDGFGAVDHHGYGRFQHAKISGVTYTSVLCNQFLDFSGRDDTSKPSWRAGFVNDGTTDRYEIARGATGSVWPGWTNLLTLSNTGRLTLGGTASPGSLGMVLLGDTTVGSAVATIDFTNSAWSVYPHLVLVLSRVTPSTAGASLLCRISVNAGSSWISTSYKSGNMWGIMEGTGAGTMGAGYGGTVNGFLIGETIKNDTAGPSDGTYWISSTSNAQKQWWGVGQNYQNSGPTLLSVWSGYCASGSTSNVTGVRLLMTSGNIASGRVQLFGMG